MDLLVKAPIKSSKKPVEIRVQNVMARSQVRPNPDNPDSISGTVLLTVKVTGPQVMRDGKVTEMPFLSSMPKQPAFLSDISEDELKQSNGNYILYETYTIYMMHWPTKAGRHTKYSVCFVKYLIAKVTI